MSDLRAWRPPIAPSGATFWVPTALALAVHLAAGFLYLVSGLLAPGWAVVLLLVGWALLTVAWVQAVRRRAWWNLAVPVVSLVTWYAVITLGEHLLGWTA